MVIYVVTTNDESGVTSVSAHTNFEAALEEARNTYNEECSEQECDGFMEVGGASLSATVNDWTIIVSPVVLK